jgi:hypothetical protein
MSLVDRESLDAYLSSDWHVDTYTATMCARNLHVDSTMS